jgi:hypothetical protein
MKTSLELRVFLKHISPEYRHAARVAYWIGAGDAIKSIRTDMAVSLQRHEADHPEAGTPFKSGRVTRRKRAAK